MKRIIAAVLAAACMLSLTACAAGKESEMDNEGAVPAVSGGSDGVRVLAQAKYPEAVKYPLQEDYLDADGNLKEDEFYKALDAWSLKSSRREALPDGTADRLAGYMDECVRQVIGGNAGENSVCSPLNIYLALAMLAETTDANSRSQILKALGEDNVENVRACAKELWNAVYSDDGRLTSIPAASLWLNGEVNYVQPTVDELADSYRASVFEGRMGSPELDSALQDWVNEQTGGLLKEQASGLKLDARTVLALITTLYFRAGWTDEFSENLTYPQPFHAPNGDVSRDFMHSAGSDDYYWADGFGAVTQWLNGGCRMWLLLPDEGVSPEELIDDGSAMEFIMANGRWDNVKRVVVKLALPKFDISSSIDLTESLKRMGVTDVFDMEASNFTPLTTDSDQLYLSKAEHAARVSINEQGVEAAAFTEFMIAAGAVMPPNDEIDFVLDRPFIFAVSSADGLPLFVGIVNTP